MIFLGNLYLSVYATSVQLGKYRCVAKRVNSIVHVQYWVQIPDYHSIQFLAISAQVKSVVFLGYKNNQLVPFCLGGLDNVHFEHLIYLLISNSLAFRTAWYGAERNGQKFIFSSSILCCTALIEPWYQSEMLSNRLIMFSNL